ncbi:hypothetical protein ACWEJS_23735 [Rhodococcus triatomae]
MKLIALSIQWNLDTADRALAKNNYRRAEHWKILDGRPDMVRHGREG